MVHLIYFTQSHIVMLKEAKENCDYLIVGLQTDPSIDRQKESTSAII